jgi:glycosyltransferase involved in cell wall biosynthesis
MGAAWRSRSSSASALSKQWPVARRFLVPPGDVVALRDRLATLLYDRRRREEMGRSARDAAYERFTWIACARRCVESYEALLGDRPQPKTAV